jgi:hypothetical protein
MNIAHRLCHGFFVGMFLALQTVRVAEGRDQDIIGAIVACPWCGSWVGHDSFLVAGRSGGNGGRDWRDEVYEEIDALKTLDIIGAYWRCPAYCCLICVPS